MAQFKLIPFETTLAKPGVVAVTACGTVVQICKPFDSDLISAHILTEYRSETLTLMMGEQRHWSLAGIPNNRLETLQRGPGLQLTQLMVMASETTSDSPWIPVTKRLPPFNKYVQVVDEFGVVWIARARGKQGKFEEWEIAPDEDGYIFVNITHWAPLLKPLVS